MLVAGLRENFFWIARRKGKSPLFCSRFAMRMV
jgi:hypothetical protein